MNEFILVAFEEIREVIIDENASGQFTGEVIEIEPGTHTISLAGDPDFAPTEQDVDPSGTSPIAPQSVIFTRV